MLSTNTLADFIQNGLNELETKYSYSIYEDIKQGKHKPQNIVGILQLINSVVPSVVGLVDNTLTYNLFLEVPSTNENYNPVAVKDDLTAFLDSVNGKTFNMDDGNSTFTTTFLKFNKIDEKPGTAITAQYNVTLIINFSVGLLNPDQELWSINGEIIPWTDYNFSWSIIGPSQPKKLNQESRIDVEFLAKAITIMCRIPDSGILAVIHNRMLRGEVRDIYTLTYSKPGLTTEYIVGLVGTVGISGRKPSTSVVTLAFQEVRV